jgi:hypothetical protein
MPTQGRNEASFRDRLVSVIDQATSWDNVVTRLLRVVSEDEKETARPFVYAFGYRLIDANAEERRQIAGAPFGPTSVASSCPHRWRMLTQMSRRSWADFLTQTDHPVALSRLHDESWRRYLCHALTDALGLNLRNRICHGLIDEVDRMHVALLIHVALFLAVLDIGAV